MLILQILEPQQSLLSFQSYDWYNDYHQRPLDISAFFPHSYLSTYVNVTSHFFKLVNLHSLINADYVDNRIMAVSVSIPGLWLLFWCYQKKQTRRCKNERFVLFWHSVNQTAEWEGLLKKICLFYVVQSLSDRSCGDMGVIISMKQAPESGIL